jgi:hypothetical protein
MCHRVIRERRLPVSVIERARAIAVIAAALGLFDPGLSGDATLTPAVTLVFDIPVLFKVVTGDGASS